MELRVSRAGNPLLRLLLNPSLQEMVLLVAVLAGLFWQFHGLADPDSRYRADRAMQAGPLVNFGQARLSTLCQHTMPARLRWRWTGACEADQTSDVTSPATLSAAMQSDFEALQRALVAGEASRKARVAPLTQSMGEGVLSEQEQDILKRTLLELSEYREQYKLGVDAAGKPTGSVVLECAWTELASRQASPGTEDATVLLANRMALIRGYGARLWWPRNPDSPDAGMQWSKGTSTACKAMGLPQNVIADGADISRRIQDGSKLSMKAAAIERMHRQAPWLIAAWATLAWVLLSLLRLTRRPVYYLPWALILWAIAGAASGLVLPATGQPVSLAVWSTMGAAGVLLIPLGRVPSVERLALWSPIPPQANVTAMSLPLAVLFLGVGWWLVFDLSLNGHVRNRYLALAQALPVFGSFVLLTVLPALAPGLARIWIAWASLVTNALRPSSGGPLKGWLRPVLIWALYVGLLAGLALVTRNWRQFTGEAFRWWLLLGVSWFFMLRADRWTQAPGGWRWLGISVLPLLIHVFATSLALLLTDDLGPVLVVMFCSAVYAGGFYAQSRLGSGAGWARAAMAGVLAALVTTIILVGSLRLAAMVPVGPLQRVAERMESSLQPFSAENDQLAHVLWFRDHLPRHGYGFGNVPWCGTMPATNCQGMPAQTQSDYTFTAIQGVFGSGVAWILLAVYLRWLSILAVRQAALTSGTLDAAQPHAPESTWLAWLAVSWAVLTVMQTLVTVAGNLGALPLTGVTWPLVSFGTWSTIGTVGFLGLVMHRMESTR